MAVSPSTIRRGGAVVEIGANELPLIKGLRSAELRVRGFAKVTSDVGKSIGGAFKGVGDSISGLGRRLAGLGTAAATPLAASVKTFASFEDAMASLRAAANPTAEQLNRINAAVSGISKATGAGPAKVAAAMTELLKAGMSLEAVLGGSTEAAIQFARVAEMDVAEAATTLTDSMNVFGSSATETVDTLSKAADASSISVRDVAMAFSMASAVAKQAGLTIGETANAIAILGQNGVKGSDAGTSLKTMLLRLQTGAESAGDVMADLGINVREADGSMKDMRGIVAELQDKLGALQGQARDEAMLKLFGTDAIRAGSILLDKGIAGWDEFNGKMAEGLPVAQKFGILMGTLSGSASKAWAAMERLGAEVGAALAPAFSDAAARLVEWVAKAAEWAKLNPKLVQGIAALAAGAIGVGTALIALGPAVATVASVFTIAGTAVAAVGTAFSGLVAVVALVATPVGAVVVAVTAAIAAFTDWGKIVDDTGRTLGSAFGSMKSTAIDAFEGIRAAIESGNTEAALKVLSAALELEWVKLTEALGTIWDDFLAGIAKGAEDAFRKIGATIGAVVPLPGKLLPGPMPRPKPPLVGPPAPPPVSPRQAAAQARLDKAIAAAKAPRGFVGPPAPQGSGQTFTTPDGQFVGPPKPAVPPPNFRPLEPAKIRPRPIREASPGQEEALRRAREFGAGQEEAQSASLARAQEMIARQRAASESRQRSAGAIIEDRKFEDTIASWRRLHDAGLSAVPAGKPFAEAGPGLAGNAFFGPKTRARIEATQERRREAGEPPKPTNVNLAGLAGGLAAGVGAEVAKVGREITDFRPDMDGILDGMDRAQRNLSGKTTFSGAALAQMGVGDTVAEDQLDQNKRTNELLEQLNRRAARGQIVFTA